MPALSTNSIAASNSASKASAKSFAHAPNKPADGSPFAMLLAATAHQSLRKQISAPDKSDAAPKPPAQADDTQASTTPTNTVRANTAQAAPSRSDDRRDKKDDKDKTDQDDDADADAPQAQAPLPATSIPVAIPMATSVAVPAAIPPGMPVNPQTFDLTAAASDSDPNQTVPAGSDDSKIDPASPQAQPVNDDVQAVQAPASPPMQTAGDDSDILNVTSPPVAVAATAQNRTDDSKPTPGKAAAAKPVAANQPDTAQNPPPVPAADANAVVQMAMAAAPAAVTTNTASDTAAATQVASIAAIATDKSDGSNAAPAAKSPQTSKSPQPASDTSAAILTQGSPTATTAPAAANGTDTAKSSGKSNSDAKPVHVADAQLPADMPVPAPQAVPTPAMPPHMAVNAFGIAAPATAAAGNSMVTSSVQVTEADADPTPDMDALAVSVAARAMSGAKQFQIRLDPPELGRVDVRLSIDASGKTQAHMTADQPQTLDLLQKDATTLTQALRDAGLDVSQSGLNFSLRGQDRQNDDSNNGAQGRRTNLIATRAIQAAQSPSAISFNGAAADARVDIHV